MILKTWVGDLPLRGLVDVFKSLRARVFVHFIPVFCPVEGGPAKGGERRQGGVSPLTRTHPLSLFPSLPGYPSALHQVVRAARYYPCRAGMFDPSRTISLSLGEPWLSGGQQGNTKEIRPTNSLGSSPKETPPLSSILDHIN